MNNRDYKLFAPNTFWHVFNRGNAKHDIFLDDEDYRFFLSRLKEYLYPPKAAFFLEDRLQGSQGSVVAESHTPYMRKGLPPESFSLLSYALMPNHYHFLIKQLAQVPISKLISKVCTSYSKYFNKKYDRVGHVFQDKFKAVLVTNDSQLMWLSAYIHNNPKTAGLVEDLQGYQWSSYLDYMGLRQGTLCDKHFILKMFQGNIEAYQKFVENSLEKTKELKDLENLLLDFP